jgi:hypothetical protein
VGTHEIDISVSDGDASWCSCTCGWTSSKTTVKASSQEWTAHVAELAFLSARTPGS